MHLKRFLKIVVLLAGVAVPCLLFGASIAPGLPPARSWRPTPPRGLS